MKTLRNMLFAIIASSLVFSTSANAGDVSLSGSMEVAFSKDTGETGNPMGLEDEMTASYSTELDNGMSVEYSMTLDRMAFDDNELKFGTDYGSFAFTSQVRLWMQMTTSHQQRSKKQNMLRTLDTLIFLHFLEMVQT